MFSITEIIIAISQLHVIIITFTFAIYNYLKFIKVTYFIYKIFRTYENNIINT